MPLKVVIVGGGIAGLTAAIAFARNGHDVHVYERRDHSRHGESGSGILLMPNVIPILKQWGMQHELEKNANPVSTTEMRMPDGEVILQRDWAQRGEAWYGLRGAFNAMFRRSAVASGAMILDSTNVSHVDPERGVLVLQDGTVVEADLIIGADGSSSNVRQDLFPQYKATTLDMACFQISTPLFEVTNDPVLSQLTSGAATVITLSPGRNIYASPAPAQNSFDIQFVDQEYSLAQDPHADLLNERITDLEWLRKRWSDHSPAYQAIIQRAESAFKWRFMEVRNLPSWSRGNVVLLGDACHSMRPFAGQGCASGIEDAAVLAKLLRTACSGDDIRRSLAEYEKIRRPRVDRIQAFATAMGHIWSCKSPGDIERRNSAWRNIKQEQIETATPDMNAAFNSPEFTAWLDRCIVMGDSRLGHL
ncbi:hypothetical protein M409DRAFT_66862 [Zasmidium cellare ATCC 36951]|uniref:FAD-binding domain-containing protein n=1 Tax=Zasmidium cellare ATCC 36951 TaxID=1080233 RepID=A0A6A6CGY0_ZASCE|nr:uncharacterized protein M409DRAFT_66862 [Zasmidium cellare ATCC 36951]KAF2165903.1 hypothetical protein M409DRAFT_66862 [Zasmidium cellare ATCC 36951]